MRLLVDASPLIYIAKLEAFDSLPNGGYEATVPASVFAEVARPPIAFRYPEIASILAAQEDGVIEVVQVTGPEQQLASEIGRRYGGLHAGELEVLALAESRSLPVCLHERQAARLAAARGVRNVHLVEILVAGTSEVGLLERRIRHFARLTNLRLEDLDRLLTLIQEPR